MKKYQLMAPGPTPVPSQVLLAMAQPILRPGAPWHFDGEATEITRGLKPMALAAIAASP